MVYNVLKHLDGLLCSSCDEGLIFDSFGELVNGDINISESSWSRLERPNYVQSLIGEWTRG
jgi:hypothetical protein